MTKFITKHPLWIIFLAALLTRLPILDGSIDFFDSPQYLWRSAVPNLIEALSSGHAPYHPGYVLFTWIFHHLTGGGPEVNPTVIGLVSVFASSVSLVLTWLIGRRLFTERVAWLATALVAVSPFFWISSITILVDPVMIVFYLLSVWLYLEWLTTSHQAKDIGHKSQRLLMPYALLLTSGLAFGYAMFAHTQVAFWVLAFPALIIALKEPRQWLMTLWRSIPWVLGPLLFIAAYVGLLLYSGHNETAKEALKYLITGNAGDRSPLEFVSGARNLRLVAGSVLAIFALLGSVRLIWKQPRLGIGLALWLWPGLIISALYVYSNLAGRASLLAIVPAALVAASMVIPPLSPRRVAGSYSDHFGSVPGGVWRKIGMAFLLLSTFATSLLLVIGYGTQAPMMEAINNVRRDLPRGGLYLSSNETQTLHDYPVFDVVYEMERSRIETDIKATLATGGPVYVGTDALTYPHYAVDGNNWRIFSLPGVNQYQKHGSLSAYLFNDYELDLVQSIGNYPLAVAEIKVASDRTVAQRYQTSLSALEPGQSVVIGRVLDAHRAEPVSHIQINAYDSSALHPARFDHSDWLTQLGTAFEVARGARTKDPLMWSYTDRSGVVAFPLPAGTTVAEYALVPHTLASGITMSTSPLFVDPTVETRAVGDQRMTGTLDALVTELASYPSVVASVTRNTDTSYSASITPVPYTLKESQIIKAGELSGHVSSILPDGSREVSPGQILNVTFGPWKSLPPGNYQATWRLRRTTEGSDRVVRLDVAYDFNPTIVEQVVGAGDLPLGELREITVPFTVEPHMKLLEFRTLALAGPGFIVDSITVRPAQ